MAKGKSTKATKAPKKQTKSKRGFQTFFLVLMAFGFGYFVAITVDVNAMSGWFKSSHKASGKHQPPLTQAVVPKPKFEFYTLLTTDQAPRVSKPATVVQPAKQPQPSPALALPTQGTYWLQVASFKQQEDADRMKAALLLKGFEVTVVKAVSDNGKFFRVTLGPFASREEARNMQSAFAVQEHIVGMIRHIDV